MGLNRQEKAAKIEEVSAVVAGAQTIVVAEYRGLDVESATKLRKQARSHGVQLRVLKNTLARRAVSAMTSSVRFPSVALSRPPTASPVLTATDSVA